MGMRLLCSYESACKEQLKLHVCSCLLSKHEASLLYAFRWDASTGISVALGLALSHGQPTWALQLDVMGCDGTLTLDAPSVPAGGHSGQCR